MQHDLGGKVHFLRLTHNFCEREDAFMGNRLQMPKQQKIREEVRRKLANTANYEAFKKCFNMLAMKSKR